MAKRMGVVTFGRGIDDFSSEIMTMRILGVPLLVLMVLSCRNYDYYSGVADDAGLVPGERFARYGREQADAVAIAQKFAEAHQGSSPEAFAKQAEAAVSFAKSLPSVAEVSADPLGHRLTVQFKSGWRTGINPVDR